MFLDYLALLMLMVSVTMSIYVLLYIHDIPHRIAKQRNHPQAEAIHVACWLSLFTLHALWPLVFMWAVSNKQALSVTLGEGGVKTASGESQSAQLAPLLARLESIEQKTKMLESRVMEGQS